ncbi:MAG: hypothetical protein ABF651_03160 [Sporolactobacillus sp.]
MASSAPSYLTTATIFFEEPGHNGEPDQGRQAGFCFFNQLSSTRFETNAAKLQMRVLANNFQVGFRNSKSRN